MAEDRACPAHTWWVEHAVVAPSHALGSSQAPDRTRDETEHQDRETTLEELPVLKRREACPCSFHGGFAQHAPRNSRHQIPVASTSVLRALVACVPYSDVGADELQGAFEEAARSACT